MAPNGHAVPNGGKHPGGRPKGVPNKRTREVVAKAEATGKMPLDIMLETMRYYYAKAQRTKVDADKELALGQAAGFAKDAAPYLHPRLTATELTGAGGKDLIPLDAIREILGEED